MGKLPPESRRLGSGMGIRRLKAPRDAGPCDKRVLGTALLHLEWGRTASLEGEAVRGGAYALTLMTWPSF